MSAPSGGASLWASPELARAYADVRTDLSPAARAVWTDAFRSALPSTPLQRLLDVGCGTGRFTALLAEVFGSPTIGVDGSPAMLRERALPASTRVAFVAAEATALPLREASIDLALLSMVYHLLAAAGAVVAAVAELHRVVRHDGRVLVRTPTLELMDRISWLPFFPGARARVLDAAPAFGRSLRGRPGALRGALSQRAPGADRRGPGPVRLSPRLSASP